MPGIMLSREDGAGNGKKTFNPFAGVWTNVCVMFPALDAKAEGYNVYVVIDASGDPSESHHGLLWLVYTGWCDSHEHQTRSPANCNRTWNRPDAAQLAGLYLAWPPQVTRRS